MTPIITLTMNPALDIATATDTVMPGHKLRCGEPRYDPGGGGINVARAVHRLGGDALAVFPVGGLSGEMLCRLLQEESVPHVPVSIAGFTRESLAVVERRSGNQYRFLLPGPLLDGHDQEHCLDALATKALGASYLVASGSLPPGISADFYARVRDLARRCGTRFVLDTSGPALAGAGHGMFLIKASLRELEELSGASIQSEEAQEKAVINIVAQGRAEIFVVSLGAQGALLATTKGVRRFAAVPVNGLSSIGAGDSMVAGIVLGLVRGLALTDAVKFGMAAGAATLLQPGTELCRREDAERLYRQMAAT
jgi:6-phosphofructokinase 2